jgi:hypothetical protein
VRRPTHLGLTNLQTRPASNSILATALWPPCGLQATLASQNPWHGPPGHLDPCYHSSLLWPICGTASCLRQLVPRTQPVLSSSPCSTFISAVKDAHCPGGPCSRQATHTQYSAHGCAKPWALPALPRSTPSFKTFELGRTG